MAKKYTIVVGLDTSPSVTSANRMGAVFERMEARIGASADRAEKRQTAASGRAADKAERDAKRKADAEERAAKRTEAVEKRKADAIEMIATRILVNDERRRQRAGDQAATQAQRDADRAVREEQRRQQRLQTVQDDFTRRDARRRAAFEAQKQRDADAATEAAGEKMGRQVVALGSAALAFGVAAAKQLSDIYREIDQRAKDAADATLDARKRLRVEATLTGTDARSGQSLLDSAKFRSRTGLGETEASDFIRQFEGSVPIGLQKFAATGGVQGMSRAVADRLKLSAGTRAARIGGDAATHGELAGLLGQFGPVKTEQEGLGKLEAIRIALTEGRGDDTPLTQQLLKSAGTMVREGGAVGTLEEQAALIGVTSLTNPEEAATFALQASRGLRAGLTKRSKVKGAEMSQASYLKDTLGITEKTSLEDALVKVAEDLNEGGGKGRDSAVYLAERGFRSDEERRAIVAITSNIDAFKMRMKAVRASSATLGPEEQAKNQQFLESTPGRAAVGDAASDAQKYAIGLKAERFRALQKEAEAEAQVGDMGAGTAVMDTLSGWMQGGGSAAGRESRVSGIVLSRLRSRANKAGVTDQELQAARSRSYGADVPFESEYVNQVESLITAKGGSNAADPTKALENLTKAVEANTKAMAAGNVQPAGPVPAKQVPAALPKAPAGQAIVPG